MYIASPPTTDPCYYGVDTPDKDKLLASNMTVDEMAEHIGADSLKFISIGGLYRAVGEKGRNTECPQYCDACFSGEYPTPLTDNNASDDDKQFSLLTDSRV
jgi:amidophosphoribosyltransferase